MLYNILMLILFLLLLLITALIVYRTYKNGISPMPSNYVMHIAVMRELDKEIGRATIVDAGSGFGHFMIKIAKRYPQHKFIGIENSIVPFLYGKVVGWIASLIKPLAVHFIFSDLYRYHYSDADIIICYLFRAGTQELYKSLKEQQASVKIISIAFAIDHLIPIKIITCQDLYRTKVYVYQL